MARQTTPEAKELRELLRRCGVTLQQIADRLGVTKARVTQQFSGFRPLHRRTVDAARALLWERIQELTRAAELASGELQQQTLEEADPATPAAVT